MDLRALLRRGEQLAQAAQYDEASTVFQDLLREDPDNIDALNNLGVVALQQRAYERGLRAFIRALRLDPESALLRENLQLLLQEPALRKPAAALLAEALRDTPEDGRHGPFRTAVQQLLAALPPPGRKRLLFLEQAGLATGGFLDPVCAGFESSFDVRHLLTTDFGEAVAAIDEADVVWLEWAGPLSAAVTQRVPALAQKPVLCRLHGFEVFTDFPAQVDWQVVDRLIFVAEHKRELFNRRFPLVQVDQRVIRNGVATEAFSVPEGKTNTKNLLLLGNLNYRKGLPMLLQFFHELRKRDPAYHLYIRGAWQDARYQMAVETMAEELQLKAHITFVHDWIPDLNAWLADKSHILSFSLEESFHYAVGNGMAAGLKPVVHAWRESRAIWPEDFIFGDLEGFLQIVLDESYTPERYRELLFERELTVETQHARIAALLEELVGEASTAPAGLA